MVIITTTTRTMTMRTAALIAARSRSRRSSSSSSSAPTASLSVVSALIFNDTTRCISHTSTRTSRSLTTASSGSTQQQPPPPPPPPHQRKQTTTKRGDVKKTKNKKTATAAVVLDIETIRAPLFDESSSTIPNVGSRPQTSLERIQNFPIGILALFKDCLRYKHIHDASKTPRNAWTINQLNKRTHESYSTAGGIVTGTTADGKTLFTTTTTTATTCTTTQKAKAAPPPSFFIYENEIRPGRIPRRQYEQQRRLKQDFRTMLPLVVLWIPPVIGFLPPLLAVVAPRQVMSSHFHSTWEKLYFGAIEYSQRVQFYEPLGDLFWNSIRDVVAVGTAADATRNTGDSNDIIRQLMMSLLIVGDNNPPPPPPPRRHHDEEDDDDGAIEDYDTAATTATATAAGPIIDAEALYSAFCPSSSSNTKNKTNKTIKQYQTQSQQNDDSDETPTSTSHLQIPHGVFTSIYDLSRDDLVQLALAVGIGQQFPLWFARVVVKYLTPSLMLRSQVNRLSEIICHDDALLLEEGHHHNMCQSLTDEEVCDACLIRGLPVVVGMATMKYGNDGDDGDDDNDDNHNHNQYYRRRYLTDHLNMIANVKRKCMNDGKPMDHHFRLFTICLPFLRYHLQMKLKMKT